MNTLSPTGPIGPVNASPLVSHEEAPYDPETVETPVGWEWSGDVVVRLDAINGFERGQEMSLDPHRRYTAIAWLTNGSQRTVIHAGSPRERDEAIVALATRISLAVGLAQYEIESDGDETADVENEE